MRAGAGGGVSNATLLAPTISRVEAEAVIPAIAADGSLYRVGKLEAHERDLHHLAISVFLMDGTRLLIQRRALGKYHCGGLWANACCTHPRWGEAAAECARRRLREELGVEVPLEQRGVVEYAAPVGNGLHERERVTMFRGEVRAPELAVRPDPAEVMDWRWIERDALAREIAETPERFTPWLRIYLARYPGCDF